MNSNLTFKYFKLLLRRIEQSLETDSVIIPPFFQRTPGTALRSDAAQLRHQAIALDLCLKHGSGTPQRIIRGAITGNRILNEPKGKFKFVNHRRGNSNVETTINFLQLRNFRLQHGMFGRRLRLIQDCEIPFDFADPTDIVVGKSSS